MAEHYLYRHFGQDGSLLYVGISLYPMARTKWHRMLSPWFSEIKNITIEPMPDRAAALSAEKQAISAECPKYNIHHIVRPSPNLMTRQEAAVLATQAAAAKKRAETLEKLPVAIPLWRDTKRNRMTTEQISERVKLSAKTLYQELGRRPAIKKGKT